MTVCIAAICNIGNDRPPCIVAACDRMITISGLQYEPKQRKVVQFGTRSIALFAGDMQLHAAVVPKVHDRLKELVADRGDLHRLLVEEIADAYAAEFSEYRKNLAEREVLAPRGLSFANLARNAAIYPHYQMRDIDLRLETYAVDSTAIIAGIDHTGAHIYRVRDPGVAESFAIPCFACAGSGKDIAEAQFMVGQYDKSWSVTKALWLTFSAKASAQVAGGVGPETDLIIISPQSNVEYATEDQIKALFSLFGRVRRKEREYNDEAVRMLEANLQSARSQAPPPPQAEPTDKPDGALGDMSSVGDTGATEPPPTSS